jgi:nitroreductase
MSAVHAPSLPPVLGAIVHRSAPVAFRPDRPPRELVERLLDAAATAPNHHLNQPWRFVVLTGAELERYADLQVEQHRRRLIKPDASEADLAATRRKALRAPVLVVVACVRTDHPKAMEIEDVEAAASAATALLLAAPDLGLGALWRTGKPAYDPEVKALLGLRPDDHIVGLLYLGYPQGTRALSPREPAHTKTTWLGWDA